MNKYRYLVKYKFASLLFMLGCANAFSQTLVGTCYSPMGSTAYYREDELIVKGDGYSNSNPSFVWNSSEPEVLIENWQATNPGDVLTREQVDAIVTPTASRSHVFGNDGKTIEAIYIGTSETYTTTLFLTRGLGLFTRVRRDDGLTPPRGAVYTAKCQFKIL